MTKLNRESNCAVCGKIFRERYADSNKQWIERKYCSPFCSNKSPKRITDIFLRLKRYQVIYKNKCWGWSGATDDKGYGVLSNRRGGKLSPEKAHRVSYEKIHGDIPLGKNICHRCDNPSCTNPKHLFVGSQKDNMMDCAKKGRLNKNSLLNLKPGAKGFHGAGPKSNKEMSNGK